MSILKACTFSCMRAAMAFAALIGSSCIPVANAQDWPVRPVRIIVAFPAGGFGDVVVRSVQNQLSAALNQPLVIDNRGGAGGNVAAAEAARSTDGHTLLLTASTTESVNPLLYQRMPVDFNKDFQHVGIMAKLQSFLFARPSFPANDFSSFLQQARTMGKVNYGSAGTGTNLHLAGELLKRRGNFEATHVPYRGAAAALQDLSAGQIDFVFGPATAMSLVQAGKLKVYGVASQSRSPSYPDVPTMAQLGYPDIQVDSYFVLYAPSAVPASAVRRLNQELNRVLERPDTQARFAELGAAPLPVAPEQSRRMVQAETLQFSELIRAGNIKAD